MDVPFPGDAESLKAMYAAHEAKKEALHAAHEAEKTAQKDSQTDDNAAPPPLASSAPAPESGASKARSDTHDDIRAEMQFQMDADTYYPKSKYIRKFGKYDRRHHGLKVRFAKIDADHPSLERFMANFAIACAAALAAVLLVCFCAEIAKEMQNARNATQAPPTVPVEGLKEIAALEASHALFPHTAAEDEHQHEPFSRAAEQIKDYKIHYFPSKAVVDHRGDTYQLTRADHKRLRTSISIECRVNTPKYHQDKTWTCFDVSTKVPGATVWYVESDERDGRWVHTLVVN